MACNIEWMSPDITEMWSVCGRLYTSEKRAKEQKQKHDNRYASYTEQSGEGWWSKVDTTLYHITLTHEVVQ